MHFCQAWYTYIAIFMFIDSVIQIGFCILYILLTHVPTPTPCWRVHETMKDETPCTGILNFTHMTISFSRFIYFTCLHTSFLVQRNHTLWVWSNIYFTPQDIFYLYNFTHACISSFVFHKSTPVGYLYFLGSHLYKYKSFFYLLSSVSSNTT
jgi:hypothetical protein